MNNIVYIILFSHKIEGSNAICSNMDGPRDYYILSEVNQKKTNIIWYYLYVESKL